MRISFECLVFSQSEKCPAPLAVSFQIEEVFLQEGCGKLGLLKPPLRQSPPWPPGATSANPSAPVPTPGSASHWPQRSRECVTAPTPPPLPESERARPAPSCSTPCASRSAI